MFSGARYSGGIPTAPAKSSEPKTEEAQKAQHAEAPEIMAEKGNVEGIDKQKDEEKEEKPNGEAVQGEGSLISLDSLDNLSIKKRLATWSSVEMSRRKLQSTNDLPVPSKKKEDDDEEEEEGILSRLRPMLQERRSSHPLRNSKIDRKNLKIRKKREMLQSLRLELQKNEKTIQELKKKQKDTEAEFEKEREQWQKEKRQLERRNLGSSSGEEGRPKAPEVVVTDASGDTNNPAEQSTENADNLNSSGGASGGRSRRRSRSFGTTPIVSVSVPDLPVYKSDTNTIDSPSNGNRSSASELSSSGEGSSASSPGGSPTLAARRVKSPLRASKDDMSLRSRPRRFLPDSEDEEEEPSSDTRTEELVFAAGDSSNSNSDEEDKDKDSKGKEEKEGEVTIVAKKRVAPQLKRQGSEELFSSLASGCVALHATTPTSPLAVSISSSELRESEHERKTKKKATVIKPAKNESRFAKGTLPLSRGLKKSGSAAAVMLPGSHGSADSTLLLSARAEALMQTRNADASERSLKRLAELHGQWGYDRKTKLMAFQQETKSATPRSSDNYRMALLQREFIDTEKAYIKGLRTLSYIAERARAKKVMGPEELQVLFPDQITRLTEMHESFLSHLKRLDQSFNNIVMKFIPRLKVYVKYFLNHPRACAVLSKCRTEERFQKFIEQCQKRLNVAQESKSFLDLDSLLIAPVQRLPRYQLLIKDLASCLQADTVDHKETVAVLKMIMHMNTDINEMVKLKENEEHLDELQQKLVDTKILGEGFAVKDKTRTRWFVKEGDIASRKKLNVEKLVASPVPHVPFMTNRRLILFDDIAIEATVNKTGQYRAKRWYRIDQNIENIKQASIQEEAIRLRDASGTERFIKFPVIDKTIWLADLRRCAEGGFVSPRKVPKESEH